MRYLLTFQPKEPFFFGGELTFSDTSYFARSELFPQQSQLLGMIRKTLMEQFGQLRYHNKGVWSDDYALAERAAGTSTFDFARKKAFLWIEEQPDFGLIRSLSPLFLIMTDDSDKPRYVTFDALDRKYTPQKREITAYQNGTKIDNYIHLHASTPRRGCHTRW